MLHYLRRGVIFGLDEEDVYVVAHGIDFEQGGILILQDAGDVGVEVDRALRRAGVGGGLSC
ncbi:MAG TPA: hypothetical protein VMR33_16695 [Candidatus Baltobacteraceae bacterium]|nr:hypothetical protein [Candidatus Baltobacteraceae bacterium]